MVAKSTIFGALAGIITLGAVILSPLGGLIPLVVLPLTTPIITIYITSRYIFHEQHVSEK